MIFICTKAKYGFCKFGKGCEKIHFTDTCENPYCNGWQCDKRHPVSCFYFDKFGRCKFGSYCSYKHKENREKILEEEVLILKKDIKKLTEIVEEMSEKIKAFEESDERNHKHDETRVEVVEIEESYSKEEDKSLSKTHNDAADKTLEGDAETEGHYDLEEEKTLEDIIRENSDSGKDFEFNCKQCEFRTDCNASLENHLESEHELFICDKCDFKANSRKGLKVHKTKKHTKVAETDGKLVSSKPVEDPTDHSFDQVCNICGFTCVLTFWKDPMTQHFKEEHDFISKEEYRSKKITLHS